MKYFLSKDPGNATKYIILHPITCTQIYRISHSGFLDAKIFFFVYVKFCNSKSLSLITFLHFFISSFTFL